ncbi:hypothetical protein QEZ54_21710 [Catellatospora sp. KI3]|uniref:hypothetical protein n=1 Tax=Catellatospora sp. KI3 TaxID=3041620 RepID=UPI0024828A0E|nr:hypothetical protein [Catellatospora sp. KI3]MDI1463604.1 hypothetical protein [Catellatospora sp. KI3]
MHRMARRAALLTAAACALVTVTITTPAAAIPPAGPNQSVTFTYFSDRAKTNEVGGWSYGSCGEPFQYGVKTAYYTVRIINC